jgi:hypothetical protein
MPVKECIVTNAKPLSIHMDSAHQVPEHRLKKKKTVVFPGGHPFK